MAETILVTGGTGFLGSYVSKELVDEGHEVIAFDRSTEDYTLRKLGVSDDISIHQGDVTDINDILLALKESGATRIIHLAAILTTTARDYPRSALNVNIGGTNNVFEAGRILSDQIERIAWSSSGAIYAPPEDYDSFPVDEDALVWPETLYGATKEYNEHQARIYKERFGLSLVGLRPTVAYGPYRLPTESGFLIDLLRKPALGQEFEVNFGDQTLDWQHAADIAEGFRKAVFAPNNNLTKLSYNIRGEIATINEVVGLLSEIIPNTNIRVSDQGALPWTHDLDISAAETDLDYEITYDLRSGLRSYVEATRKEEGLDPI